MMANVNARIDSSIVVGRRSIRISATDRLWRERLTEITVEKVPEVVEELDDDRLVEPLALVEGVADLVRRPFAEGGPARVAGDDAGEDEDRGDDPEQHRDRRHQAVECESNHATIDDGGGRAAAPPPSST